MDDTKTIYIQGWTCGCGKWNEDDTEKCSLCKRDRDRSREYGRIEPMVYKD